MHSGPVFSFVGPLSRRSGLGCPQALQRPAIATAEAVDLAGWLSQSFTVWAVDEMTVLEAARGVRDHGLSYWDAQIWASARLHQGRIVLSEDFADGLVLEGISFVDPFRAGFDLESLLLA